MKKIIRNAASEIVIELRGALGDLSQQVFAHEFIRSSIVTVGRWETSHPPTGNALLKLYAIANKYKLFGIACRLWAIYIQEVERKISRFQQQL